MNSMLTASPALTDSALRLVSWMDVYDSCIARGWSHESAALAAQRHVTA